MEGVILSTDNSNVSTELYLLRMVEVVTYEQCYGKCMSKSHRDNTPLRVQISYLRPLSDIFEMRVFLGHFGSRWIMRHVIKMHDSNVTVLSLQHGNITVHTGLMRRQWNCNNSNINHFMQIEFDDLLL